MHLPYFVPIIAALVASSCTVWGQPLYAHETIIASAPPEAHAVLKSVSTSGSGCANNSASFLIKDSATLAFDSMVVDSTEAVPTKKCTVVIDLALDSKWSYTINQATVIRGYGVHGSGNFAAVYTVGTKTSQAKTDIKLANPGGENYGITLAQDSGATSACGGGTASIAISLQLLRDKVEEALITLDTMDIGFGYSKC